MQQKIADFLFIVSWWVFWIALIHKVNTHDTAYAVMVACIAIAITSIVVAYGEED